MISLISGRVLSVDNLKKVGERVFQRGGNDGMKCYRGGVIVGRQMFEEKCLVVNMFRKGCLG